MQHGAVHAAKMSNQMKTLAFVLSLSICLPFCIASYEDCGSVAGAFTNITVTGCDPSSTCILKRNSVVTIDIYFSAKKSSPTLTALVHGIIEGMAVPFPLKNPDGCKDSGVSCPITEGTDYHYTASFDVKKQYPKLNVKVKWELQTDQKEDVICALIPSKIQ